MAEKCTVYQLSVANLADAAKDPALAALVAEGWGVLGSVVVQGGPGGDPELHLLLHPPRQNSFSPALVFWVRAYFGVQVALALLCLGTVVGCVAYLVVLGG